MNRSGGETGREPTHHRSITDVTVFNLAYVTGTDRSNCQWVIRAVWAKSVPTHCASWSEFSRCMSDRLPTCRRRLGEKRTQPKAVERQRSTTQRARMSHLITPAVTPRAARSGRKAHLDLILTDPSHGAAGNPPDEMTLRTREDNHLRRWTLAWRGAELVHLIQSSAASA